MDSWIRFLVALLMLWGAQLSSYAQVSHELVAMDASLGAVNHITVTVDGSQLDQEVLGFPISHYRLYQFKQQRFSEIPMQIDHLDTAGHVLVEGSHNDQLEVNLSDFNANGQLMFMYSDSSSERGCSSVAECQSTDWGSAEWKSKGLPRLASLQEVEVRLNEETTFVYLARLSAPFEHPASHHAYIRVAEGDSGVETASYRFYFVSEDPLEGQDFYYGENQGEQDVIYDGVKVRVIGKVLGAARLTLNNRNVESRVSGVRSGPIRTTFQVRSRLKIFKVPVMTIDLQIYFYPNSMGVLAWAKLPMRAMKLFFWDADTLMTIDGNNLLGATVEVIGLDDFHGVVDGRMSPDELAYSRAPLDSQNNWARMVTPRGFQAISRFSAPEKYDLAVSLVYEDDALRKNKPERFIGQLPNLGYQIAEVERYKALELGLTLHFEAAEPVVPLQEYVKVLQSKPVTTVRSLHSQLHSQHSNSSH